MHSLSISTGQGVLGLLKMSPVSQQQDTLCSSSESEMRRLETCETPCRVEALSVVKGQTVPVAGMFIQ